MPVYVLKQNQADGEIIVSVKEEKDAESIEIVNEFNDYKAIDINSTNLIELVVSRLDRQEHNDEDIDYISSQLKEVL